MTNLSPRSPRLATGDRPRIGLILSTTRANRFADVPADWLTAQLASRTDWAVEVLDLRDQNLPFFDELSSNLYAPSKDPRVLAWQEKLAGFDGFLFLVAEYNRSIPAVLKNALDQAYVEWGHKPAGFMGYGGLGASAAIEHLRQIAVELKMVPLKPSVHIAASDFHKVHPMLGNQPISEIDGPMQGAVAALVDEMNWWLGATIAARA